ncbi:MAG: hypothetical protein ACQEQM_07895 [Thermoplasmatota archaeon]
MNKLTKIMSILTLLVILFAINVPMTSQAQTDVPEWNEGDSWAMGYEKDLDVLFAPGLDMIRDQIEGDLETEEEFESFDFNFEGDVSTYYVFEVVEEGDDYYVLEIYAGTEVKMQGDFEATGQLPKEGTSEEDNDTETRTISGDGDLHYMSKLTGEAVFTKNELALESLEFDIEMSIEGNLNLYNFPDIEILEEKEEFQYRDYSFGIIFNFEASIEMSFDPALDIYNFPIEENTNWIANSTMTISGTYQGKFDITGIPEELKQDIAEEMGMEFPIIFEDLEVEDIDEVEYGTIEETNSPVEIPMKCTGTDTIVLHDGTTVDVYILEFDMPTSPYQPTPPSFMMKYSSEHGNIVTTESSLTNTQFGEFVADDNIEMESVETSEARQNIDAMGEEEENGLPIPFASTQMVMISLIVAVMIAMILKTKVPKNKN